MRKLKNDLTGRKFGRLTVLGVDERGTRKTYYNCLCECGNVKSVRADSLAIGAIRSCGCLKKEQDRINLEANHSHKMSGTRLYRIWQNMKSRCSNNHDARFHRYGGRGITVCDEWNNNFSSFYEWSMANGYKDDLTIDRINIDGNYEPSNCRWATNKEQSNNRSTNIYITIGNSRRTLQEWCDIFLLDYATINARYNRNGYIGIDELFNK